MIKDESFCIKRYLVNDPNIEYKTKVKFYNNNKIQIIGLYWYKNYSVRFLMNFYGRGTFNGFNRLLSYYFGDYHKLRCKLLGRINRGLHITRLNNIRVANGTNPFSSKNRKLDENGRDIIAKKAKETARVNHTNPFYHENLVLDEDSKSIIHKRSRATILKNGTCPFSHKNRPKLPDGRDAYQVRVWKSRRLNNLKKYGSMSNSWGYWKRTIENSDPASEYFLTDDAIKNHNYELYKKCYIRFRKLYAEKFRRNIFRSKPELLLGSLINDLGYYYKAQYQIFKIGGWCYFADYYIPELNVVVECDGNYKYINKKLHYKYIDRALKIESVIKGRVVNISEVDIYYYKTHLDELNLLLKGGINNGRNILHG